MLNLLDIFEGVKGVLAEQFPELAIYEKRAPRGFVRPSLLIECGPVKQSELGGMYVSFDVDAKVTCFEPVDDYGNAEPVALMARMCTVMGLFSGGFLPMGNRAPHVTALQGDYQLDYAEVLLKLQFHERWDQGEPYPLMAEIHTNLKGEPANGITEY